MLVSGSCHPTARIGEGVVIEPGAVVGREAAIGNGTTVAANAVVGYELCSAKIAMSAPAQRSYMRSSATKSLFILACE